MKVSDHILIGTILALPPVTHALRVAIVRADSPSTAPYPSSYVDCWVIEINPKTGHLLSVASGCYHKEKVHLLVLEDEQAKKKRDENLLMCELKPEWAR